MILGFPVTSRPSRRGFTIMEMLVATAVLVLIMVMLSKLFTSAMAVTGLRNKQMDADAQARAVFDRMAVDFSQMVKRPDVDYFLKSSSPDQYGMSQLQPGNDQLAFYSQVPGYYPAGSGTAAQSPLSLVAYRVSDGQLQRYGFGLQWNGASTTGDTQMIYSYGPDGATSCSGTYNAITNNWPNAANLAADPDYEVSGPQVFRMEYYYVIKGQTVAGVSYPSVLTDIPWDTRIPGHNSVCGLQDVAAIGVIIAVADPKTRMLVNDVQLIALGASMEDFPSISSQPPDPGQIEAQWQSQINNSSNGIPLLAASSIRIYARTFYLPPN